MQSIGHDLRRGINSLGTGNYKNINKWLAELKNIESTLKTLDKEIVTSAKLISGWGTNEGDDLTDVCQRMTQVMEEFGLIHQAYSMKHTAFRKQIKALKTQEMTLDDNRKKKQDLTQQITKHQKSSKENPIKLMELHNAHDRVSAELLSQELDLLQFKRVTIRDAFNTQMDAMVEFGEKMALIAAYGRQITNVIDTGPQQAQSAPLYSGAEYTAVAINQVKFVVTNWQPVSVNAPVRTHLIAAQDDLALPAVTSAYQYPSRSREASSSDGYGHMSTYAAGGAGGVYTTGEDQYPAGEWNDVPVTAVEDGRASVHGGGSRRGSEYDHWKQEIEQIADYSPHHGNTLGTGKGTNSMGPVGPADDMPSPFLQTQQITQLHEQQRQLQLEQQRAYQHMSHPATASAIASGLRNTGSMDSYGNGNSKGNDNGLTNASGPISGRFLTSTPRRNDTQEYYSGSAQSESPSPSYLSFQPAPTYQNALSSSPTYEGGNGNGSVSSGRGPRLGFSDPRDRGRGSPTTSVDRLDNSDLYKHDVTSSIISRYTKTSSVMEGK